MKWHVEFHQIPWDTSGSANPDGERMAHLFRVILFSHTKHKNPLKMILLFLFIFLWEKLALCWHQPLSLAGNFSQGEKKIERMVFKTKKMTWLRFSCLTLKINECKYTFLLNKNKFWCNPLNRCCFIQFLQCSCKKIIIFPIIQMRKLQIREEKTFSKNKTARNWCNPTQGFILFQISCSFLFPLMQHCVYVCV